MAFKAAGEFHTTLQSISSNDLWKDRQNANLSFDYSISNKLSIEPMFSSYILSDQLAGFNNDVTKFSALTRVNYQPHAKVRISPKFGGKWQTQAGQSDQGFSIGGDAYLHDMEFDGYRNQLTVFGEQDFFPQRRNQNFRIRYKVDRQFQESTADTLIIIFDRLRRDNFDADEDGIFIRNLTQATRGFQNFLGYQVSSIATLHLKSSLLATTFRVNHLRDSEDDLRKDDTGFISTHSVNLNIRKAKWQSNFLWNYRFRSREDNRPVDRTPDPFGRFPTVGFDNDDLMVSLRASSGLKISANDSLGLHASVLKFRYHTSDTTNPNDHDQLKWQLTFTHTHKFNPNLTLGWRASAFMNHFIFIAGRFSGGNNWDRTFQLSPEIIYEPSNSLSITQRFTVRAKYQTFDFNNLLTANRDIVNRQFILTNHSRLDLTAKDRLEFSFNLELAEQGRLFFDRWRQTLALSWRNHEVQFSYRHEFNPNFVIAPGASLYQQVRWNHRPTVGGGLEKSVRDKHTNFGPILEISYRPRPSLELVFFGNIQIVNSSRRDTNQINNFDLYMNWFF